MSFLATFQGQSVPDLKKPYVKLSISFPWPVSKKGSRAATFQSPEQGVTGRHSSPNMLFLKKKKKNKPKYYSFP